MGTIILIPIAILCRGLAVGLDMLEEWGYPGISAE